MNARQRFKDHKRIVIKLGTTSLTFPNGRLNLKMIEKLSWVLTDLRNQGKEIILVSSGAIAVGADRLKLPERPRDIRGKQAASAVGQAVLMQIYENFFMTYNQIVAQVLLTRDVLDDEVRKQNARNTFSTLLSMGVIPIVNENDTVSTDELEFSDNDTLSAYVACLVEGDGLIILSDIEGLYDQDPKIYPQARLIHLVENIDQDIVDSAGDSQSALGTGGMATKITAAKLATSHGIDTVVASGQNPDVLFSLLNGNEVGTLFLGKSC